MASHPSPGDLIPLSPRDLVVLTVMAEGPIHGYGIVTAAQERFGATVPLDPANLYRSLKRLMRDGVVLEAGGEGGDGRRTYALTALGRQVLDLEVARLRVVTDAAILARTGDGAREDAPEPA